MSQWVKVLAEKPDDLSSISKTQIQVEGENQCLKVVLCPPNLYHGNHASLPPIITIFLKTLSFLVIIQLLIRLLIVDLITSQD